MTLKKYKTIHEVYIPIFEQFIYVWIEDREDFNNFFEDNFPNIPIEFWWKAVTYSSNDWRLCVYISDKSDQYTILHECVHITFHIIKNCWIEMGEDEEVFAYLYEYIVKSMHKIIK